MSQFKVNDNSWRTGVGNLEFDFLSEVLFHFYFEKSLLVQVVSALTRSRKHGFESHIEVKTIIMRRNWQTLLARLARNWLRSTRTFIGFMTNCRFDSYHDSINKFIEILVPQLSWLEHLTHNQGVAGSSPAGTTKF